ncbi:MAG: hypothetical protein E7367_04125 [Clostridiales bacterium]|nr:hypothetical protein [Clostridiales bacterium]
MGWNNELAITWTKMVGPSRPTVSELTIYSEYVHKLMDYEKRQLRILILGSTPELRDWAFEENLDVWVMDANPDYHYTINREMRHKCIVNKTYGQETFIQEYWQNLNYVSFFDIIIGDLAIGNIPPDKVELFIQKVSTALTPNGLFLGKSFLVPQNYQPVDFEKLLSNYYSGAPYHPYSFLSFYLTMECIDENNLLDFQVQYNKLLELHRNKWITDEFLEAFKGVGWDKEMKFKFFVPNRIDYERLLDKYLHIYTVEYGKDVYSPNFPLHIVTTKQSTLFGGNK